MISIGPAGFMAAPKEPAKSIAFLSGYDAAKQKIPLKKSAIKNMMPGSDRYYDYLDGYDSFKQKSNTQKE